MSHLPVSLMNRLKQTVSAVSNFGCCTSDYSMMCFFRHKHMDGGKVFCSEECANSEGGLSLFTVNTLQEE